jgi:eukaryotic-like serine/threonine-protein kinase
MEAEEEEPGAATLTDTLVSHYRVLHPLGEGGMGEVYAALDETLRRRVALKVIRAEHRLNPESKARFLREAQILSGLDHPNICRVYDYIEGDDRDWLVLELIEGKSLKVALSGGIDSARALRIAQQLADVLVVTHAAGIVHRDLKPANVMLTGQDRVKVLDFGLAVSGVVSRVAAPAAPPTAAPDRLPLAADDGGQDDTVEATAFLSTGGSLLGTIAYMSPEQARGETATTASDMFSLGMVLQEMFTGHHPHPREFDGVALLARVQRGETDPPSGIRKDLAELLRRLTSPSPAARPTAVDTAERVRWIRSRSRRRLRAAAVAATLALVALAGVKYTVDLARERTIAVEARDEADRRREQAESLIEFMLGDLRTKLEPVGRLDILDSVGERAMAYFGAVPEHQLSDRELMRRSTALYQIGSVRISRGQLNEATAPLQESLALAKVLAQRRPDDPERLFELGQSHYWVGYVHWRRRQLDDALREFEQYLRVSETLVGQHPDNHDWLLELSYANSNIGSVLEERGELEPALTKFGECLRIEQALLESSPGDNTLRRAVAASHNTSGVVSRSLGRLDEAMAHHQAELALQEELVTREPGNMRWEMFRAVANNYVGQLHQAAGRPADADVHYRRATAIARRLVEHDATNMTWQRELGRSHFRLGRLLVTSAPTAALSELEPSVSRLRTVAAADPSSAGWQRDLAEALHARGEARLRTGGTAAASRDAAEAAGLAAALLARSLDDREARRIQASALLLRGEAAAAQQDRAAAAAAWAEAAATIEPLARQSADYRLLEPWAISLLRLGRHDEASQVLQRLEAIGYRDQAFSRAVRGLPLRPARSDR